jgi:hypothetical protein
MIRVRDRRAPGIRLPGGVLATLTIGALVVSPIGIAPGAGAAADAKPALCAASAVRVTATTNRHGYLPAQMVVMTSSATNVSDTACSLYLGLDPGFSPAFIVMNGDKTEVWDRCWVDDHPGGCFEILYQHVLQPGRTYHTTATWDQGSSTGTQPPERVPPGTYTFLTYFGYIDHLARAHFEIKPPITVSTAG